MPEERRAYWRGRVMERRQLLYLAVGGILTFGIVHYVTHQRDTCNTSAAVSCIHERTVYEVGRIFVYHGNGDPSVFCI